MQNENELGFAKPRRPLYYDESIGKWEMLHKKIGQLNSALEKVSSPFRGGNKRSQWRLNLMSMAKAMAKPYDRLHNCLQDPRSYTPTKFQRILDLKVSCPKTSDNVPESSLYRWGFDFVHASHFCCSDGIVGHAGFKSFCRASRQFLREGGKFS